MEGQNESRTSFNSVFFLKDISIEALTMICFEKIKNYSCLVSLTEKQKFYTYVSVHGRVKKKREK